MTGPRILTGRLGQAAELDALATAARGYQRCQGAEDAAAADRGTRWWKSNLARARRQGSRPA